MILTNQRWYVADAAAVAELKGRLQKSLSRGSDELAEFEIHWVSSDGTEDWLETALWDHFAARPSCLIKLPRLSTNSIAMLIAETPHYDELVAASLVEFWYNRPNRPLLIRELEIAGKVGDASTWERIGYAIIWADLQSRSNYKPTVGKSHREIDSDYESICALADRADNLLAKAEEICKMKFSKKRELFNFHYSGDL